MVLLLLALSGCGGSERDAPQPPAQPTRLFLAGDGELTVVDVDAARAEVHRLPVLAPGDPLYRIVRRGDKLVVFGFDTYVLDPDVPSVPRKLGDSWYFVPSSEHDRVWLTDLDETSPDTRRRIASVREMSVAGDVTFPAVQPPRGQGPLTGVGEELVFDDRRGGLELWSPSTGEVTRHLPDAALGAAHENLLAWCEDEGRVLHVTDVESGDDRTIEPPEAFTAFDCWSAAFAPDGTTLALAAMYGDAYDQDRTLVLVDLGDGEAMPINGSTVQPLYVYVAWSSAGDRVFVTGRSDEGFSLLEYRVGAPSAVRIPVRVRDFYGMAAT